MMWPTPVYSLTYPATPNDESSRTSSAFAIVPLKTTIGRRLRRHPPNAANEVDAATVGQPQIEYHQVDPVRGARSAASSSWTVRTVTARWPAPSRAVRNRSRTKAVSSAISTVLTATMVVAVTRLTYRYGPAATLVRVARSVSSSL